MKTTAEPIEEIILKLKTPNYFDTTERVEVFFEKSLNQVAEHAKLEERKRIFNNVPPKMSHFYSSGSTDYKKGYNDCLNEVRSIITNPNNAK